VVRISRNLKKRMNPAHRRSLVEEMEDLLLQTSMAIKDV
jgi:hypothetical protein